MKQQCRREVNRIVCSERVAGQKGTRRSNDLGRDFDDLETGHVIVHGSDEAVSFAARERPLPGSPSKRRSDLGDGQAIRCARDAFEKTPHEIRMLLEHVALHERARVEVSNQNRSSRSSKIVWDTGDPGMTMGSKGGSDALELRVSSPEASSTSSVA